MNAQTDFTKIKTKSKTLPAHLWKPGQSGNPNGRPKGSRSQLPEKFIDVLLASFQARGVEAVDRMISEKPNEYVRVIASILPKELLIKQQNAMAEMSDSDLSALLERVQGQLKVIEGDVMPVSQHASEADKLMGDQDDQYTDVQYTDVSPDSLIDDLMG